MTNAVEQPQVNLQSNGIGANNSQDNRTSQRSTMAEIERQQQEARLNADSAKQKQQVYAAIAQYNSSGAEQERIQGQNLIQTGNVKSGIGYGMVGMGSGLMAAGFAMMAIPGAQGAAGGMISSGISTMGQGIQQVAMGNVDKSQGEQALARAQEKLEKATQNEILSKSEAKTLQKEMTRSQLFEMKKALFESMQDEFKPMLEKMGVQTDNMSEEEMMQWFDKFFEDGAKTAANGGILETNLADINGNPMFQDANGDPLTGTFNFLQGENGEFFMVEPLMDEEGNMTVDAEGKPVLNTSKTTKVEDPALKAYLETQFMFAGVAEDMANQLGLSPEDFGQMAMKVNFTDIYSGASPGPLKFVTEGGVMYAQQWDWKNDVPLGPKVPFDDITGGEFDRGNLESYQNAMERSKNALETLGLNAGGDVFDYVNQQETLGYNPPVQGNSIDNLLAMDRDSDAFAEFARMGSSNNNQNILNEPSSDDVPDGEA